MCFDTRREMTNIESQLYNTFRILFITVGLWPYQRTKIVRFQFVLFSTILISFTVFQLTTLMTAPLSITFVIKILSTALLLITVVVNYISFWFNTQSVKFLLQQFQCIYNELKDKNEIAILEKYAYDGKQFVFTMLLLTICGLVFIVTQPFWSYIFNILLFINGSQSCCTVPIITEYFIDQEKYFYIILLHLDMTSGIAAISLAATGLLLVVTLKHACGLFTIASYRIEQAMTNNLLKNTNLKNEMFMYKKIIYAVDIHRKAMQYAEITVGKFQKLFFFLITTDVFCLSLNLYRISQIMSHGQDIEEISPSVLCGFIIILYIFLANYFGQQVTDHNDYVCYTAYNVRWYIAPLHIQKLILFLLQRGNKTFSLTIVGLFTASLKCFASMVSASVSYFTVIYSTQQ